MLRMKKIEAVLIHTYCDGSYLDTRQIVYTKQRAMKYCESYNRINHPEKKAVLEEVEILPNPASHIDR